MSLCMYALLPIIKAMQVHRHSAAETRATTSAKLQDCPAKQND